MDPDDEHCQPKLRRQLEDVDYVPAEFENKLNWQDIVAYKASYTYLLLRVLFIFLKISTSRSTYYAQLHIAPTC
jgi:hypothetical protein